MRARERVERLRARDLLRRWWRPALVVLAAVLAVVWRLVKDDLGAPPNLELSTAAAFLAAGLLRHRVAALVPLVVVAASDLLLGNSAVLAFTWTAWAAIGLVSLLTPRAGGGWRRYAAAVGFGVGGTLLFYLWTNLGVWWLGRGTFYPAGPDGLLASYVAGLPFLRPMVLGNLVLVPAAAVVVALVERFERRATVPAPAAAPAR
jgi:hypothetical protein